MHPGLMSLVPNHKHNARLMAHLVSAPYCDVIYPCELGCKLTAPVGGILWVNGQEVDEGETITVMRGDQLNWTPGYSA